MTSVNELILEKGQENFVHEKETSKRTFALIFVLIFPFDLSK